MQGMPARNGETKRGARPGVPKREAASGLRAMFAKVDPEVKDTVDLVAQALNQPIAVVLEKYVRNAPTDPDTGLPIWATEIVAEEQLPLAGLTAA
jgi:hypothetical protein